MLIEIIYHYISVVSACYKYVCVCVCVCVRVVLDVNHMVLDPAEIGYTQYTVCPRYM